jgi:hypothetical protein
VQAEAERDPPAESSSDRGFGRVDEEPSAFPSQQTLLDGTVNAQFDGKLLLGPRSVFG